MKSSLAACAAVFAVASAAQADTRPDSHAPISIMGDHIHEQGEFMFSYRYMHMSMEGNRDGSSSRSPEEIATTTPNIFFGMPNMPPTLRVVPTDMDMDMHMLGIMYAPTDKLTLMGMFNYIEKEMTHLTFAGGMGTNQLGKFTTRTSGFGDTSLSALYGLSAENATHRVHATFGLSLPTGDIEETDQILTPMNMQPSVRLPYPMQLGSGTYDLITGLTYASESGPLGWGSQWRSIIRLDENDEDYTLGDEHQLQGWVSYLVGSSLSVSARLGYFDRDKIEGIDPMIRAPVQTADPDRQGGERVEFGLGVNFLLPSQKHRVALEANIPVMQELNGPQLETDWTVTLGWQYTP